MISIVSIDIILEYFIVGTGISRENTVTPVYSLKVYSPLSGCRLQVTPAATGSIAPPMHDTEGLFLVYH